MSLRTRAGGAFEIIVFLNKPLKLSYAVYRSDSSRKIP